MLAPTIWNQMFPVHSNVPTCIQAHRVPVSLLIQSLQQLCELGFPVSIFQMKKLRLNKVTQVAAGGHRVVDSFESKSDFSLLHSHQHIF
jgi:hypothetical protein